MEKTKEFLKKLETDSEPGLSNAQLMLASDDLKPVEAARRTWGPWNFVGFWVSDSFNINTWMITSSMILSGLSWWQSWLCIWVGYFFAAIFICSTGHIGATYHIPFPVVARASFGIWGSLWPIFNRAAMACVWYGVQTWIGGTCVYLMIRSIWTSFEDLPNTMPAGSGTNTRDFVSFFLFWVCSLPAIWFPVHQIRHLFTVKSYIVPVAGFAFFGWCIKKSGGVGPIIHQRNTAHGSTLAWALVKGVMSSIANFSTLIVNDPDFTRFAAKPKDALWSQLFAIPTCFAITSFIGIIVSSSSTIIYNHPIWNPLDLLSLFLDGNANPGTRTAVFFISTSFALAQLGTNISANSISAGTDLTALLPRYLTIRRGGYLCALVGFVMTPWRLLASSNNFTTYLSAYSVFLSSIAGVMICDYYLVRRGLLLVAELYDAHSAGAYYFSAGWNGRAYVAYLAGILVNVVGFVGAVGGSAPVVAEYIYNVNFFAGFIVSSGVYYSLCRVWPVPGCAGCWTEVVEGEEGGSVQLAYDGGGGADGEGDGGVGKGRAASFREVKCCGSVV